MTQSTLRSGLTPTPCPHPCKLTPKKLPSNFLPIFLTFSEYSPNKLIQLPQKYYRATLLPILLNLASTARKHSLKESK